MTIIAIASYFCHCHLCTPSPPQPTASGAWPREGITVAGPRWVKLGTRVLINGKPYVVQDRTARRWDGKRWDIFVSDHQRAKRLGIRKVKITIP